MSILFISDRPFSLSDFAPFLNHPVTVRLTEKSRRVVQNSSRMFQTLLEKGTRIYGVNTGFGQLSQVLIDEEDQKQLQVNLVRSHAAGVGKPFDQGITRMILCLKILSLSKGASGVRPEVIDLMLECLCHDILPIIPRQGSVGASGDLAPLAHMTLALMGEGMVHFQERDMPSMLALKECGLEPLTLQPKEGLSLVNGTQVSTALAIKAVLGARKLLQTADTIAACAIEASLSSRDVFKPAIHRLKRHPGQRHSAGNIWKLLKGSEIVLSHKDCHKIQDPYSMRCVPHVHGACRDLVRMVEKVVENEINSVSDNPLILANGELVNSGHFHAEPIAQALDCLAIALCEIGGIAERRIHYFMKGIEDKIPPFVAGNPGLESGFMLAHVTASSLVSENKTLSHPASVDSIPTSAGQEDFVSMAPWAGRKVLRIMNNVHRILAIELLVVSTATVCYHKGLRPGDGIRPVLNLLRRHIRFSVGDRVILNDLEVITQLIASGKVTDQVLKTITLE